MEPIPATPTEFIALLYRGSTPPAGFVEFRFLPKRSRVFMPWPVFAGHPDEFKASQIPRTQDSYWGVSLRIAEGKGGAQDVHPTHLVWIDIDLKGTAWTHGQTDVQHMEPADIRACAEAAFAHYLAAFNAARIPPRAVVYTGHGLQVYWARNTRSDAADTETFNRGLAAAFQGDPKTVDVARIFRLPGSWNLKNPERPLPVELWRADGSAGVTRELLEQFPAPTPERAQATPEQAAQNAPSRPAGESGDVVGQWNARHPITEVLERNGYVREDSRTYTRPGDDASGRDVRLLENKRGVLSSYHHSSNDPMSDGPEGEHLQEPFDLFVRLEHGGNFAGAVKAAAAELGIQGQAGKAGKITGNSSAMKKPKVQKLDTDAIDKISPKAEGSGIYTANGNYYIDRPIKRNGEVVDWTPEKLTNWVWEPTLKLHYPDGTFGERGALTIGGHDRHEIQIESKAWNGRKDLLEIVGGYQARCFTTNNTDIAKIGDYVNVSFPDLPQARGVKSYGLHEHNGQWVRLYEDRAISDSEIPELFYSGTAVDPGSRSFHSPRLATETKIDEARRAIIKLTGLISTNVALALLGYGAASAFSPRITPHLGNRLPFMFLAGEKESGKTSGAQIVLELMTGYSTRITKASGMTQYQYDIAHSSANNLLALLDEYRPGEIDDGQLRKHHDLTVKFRGTGIAEKNLAYELNAPLIVMGEGFTDDAATKSRGVLYFVRKRDRGDVNAYSEVLKLPLWAYSEHLHELARTTPEVNHMARMARAIELAVGASGADSNPRLRYALTYIAYGLLVLQADVEPSAFRDEDISAVLAEGAYNTLEGGTEGMTNLEMFLEQLSVSLARVPNPGAYVVPSALAGDLILRPKACLDLVKQHYKESAAIANPVLLRQYADQAEYFDDGETHKSDEGVVIRGKRLCLAQIPQRCDADLLLEFNRTLRRG